MRTTNSRGPDRSALPPAPPAPSPQVSPAHLGLRHLYDLGRLKFLLVTIDVCAVLEC